MLASALLLLAAPAVATALPLYDGDVVVSGSGASGTGLIAIDPETGAERLITSGQFGDFGIADATTIYALSGNSVVRVDTTTGAQSVLTSGGLLSSATGIAVDANEAIFVLDDATPADAGEVVRVEFSGEQSRLATTIAAADLIDLEILASGDLVYIGGESIRESIIEMSALDGSQTVLLDNFAARQGEDVFGPTGLGVDPEGDIWVSDGEGNGTKVMRIDGATGVAVRDGSTVASPIDLEMLRTDMAFSRDQSWIVGNIIFGGGQGLFRYEAGRPVLEPGGIPFVSGQFGEVQVFNAPVPEPSALLLFASGLLAVSAARSGSRRRG